MLRAVLLKGNGSGCSGHIQQEINRVWQFISRQGQGSVTIDLTQETADLGALPQMHSQCQKGAEFLQEYNLYPRAFQE